MIEAGHRPPAPGTVAHCRPDRVGRLGYDPIRTSYQRHPTHVVLPWIHRVFALMKRWGLGTYHGLRRKHVDTYLNEFVFRYNRRFYRHASFETMLGLAEHHEPASYWEVIGRANPRKGNVVLRRVPRRRKTETGMRQDGSASAQTMGQNQALNAGVQLHMDEPGTTQ
jgi:ISXO2-like transposase domain